MLRWRPLPVGVEPTTARHLSNLLLYILHYRSDSHYIEVAEASLQDFAGYIQTWSGFQKYKQVHGDASAEAVIAEFLSE